VRFTRSSRPRPLAAVASREGERSDGLGPCLMPGMMQPGATPLWTPGGNSSLQAERTCPSPNLLHWPMSCSRFGRTSAQSAPSSPARSPFAATWAQGAYLREPAMPLSRVKASLASEAGGETALEAYGGTMAGNRTNASGGSSAPGPALSSGSRPGSCPSGSPPFGSMPISLHRVLGRDAHAGFPGLRITDP
jgi:hypothetical protein